MTFCALTLSSQKPGSVMRFSKSAISSVNASRSSVPRKRAIFSSISAKACLASIISIPVSLQNKNEHKVRYNYATVNHQAW